MNELALPQGARHTATALILPEGLPIEQWIEAGRFLQAAQRAAALWRADWLRYGETAYGAPAARLHARQLEFEFKEIKALETLGTVNPDQRNADLSPEHHFVVGKLCKTPDEQESWLRAAWRDDLSPRELQASIRAGKVTRIDAAKRKLEMPSPFGVWKAFKQWREALGDGWKKWTREDCIMVLEELAPIADFAQLINEHMKAISTEEPSAGGRPNRRSK